MHNQTLERYTFNRNRMPRPADFYAGEGVRLQGAGVWRNALCPFHEDRKPSLRVFFGTGAFRCMACGARGDMLSFFMQRHSASFIDAAKALGAWEALR